MRFRAWLAVVFAVLALSLPALALDLSGDSRAYLQSREAFDGSKLLPLFEYLDFKAEDIGSKALSFHFGGWARWDLRNDSTSGKDKNSDLQYAYLSVRGGFGDSVLRLGRIPVSEGVANGQIDGAYGRTSLAGGFTIAAFGGVPVETDFDGRNGDAIMGGRISQGMTDWYRVGVSYLKERNGIPVNNGKALSNVFREDEGVDLWFRPLPLLELSGASFRNAVTDNWMYHSYTAAIGPFAGVRLTAQGTKVDYGDYFTSSTTSAFRFDPSVIDPKEKMKNFGEEASWTGGGVTLAANYRSYDYSIAGNAKSWGARFGWAAGRSGAAGLSYQRMDGATKALRYDQYRVYGRAGLGHVDITADYFVVRYDAAINMVKNAYSAILGAGYALTPQAKVSADVEYGRNPFYKKDTRGLVKFVWAFDTAAGRTAK